MAPTAAARRRNIAHHHSTGSRAKTSVRDHHRGTIVTPHNSGTLPEETNSQATINTQTDNIITMVNSNAMAVNSNINGSNVRSRKTNRRCQWRRKCVNSWPKLGTPLGPGVKTINRNDNSAWKECRSVILNYSFFVVMVTGIEVMDGLLGSR